MTDNKNIINCPACGHIMDKVYIPSENIDVDICSDGCGGVFYDKGEIYLIGKDLKNLKDIREYLEKYYSEVDFVHVDEDSLRICPICKIDMDKSYVADGSVQIDSCQSCGGIFLDRGELEKIRDAVIKD